MVGGGVCGLWLLAALRNSGRHAILIERDTLGGQQTLASQGMIHGGIKYALGGFTTPSSETIASMPARWKACISGNDLVNLAGVDVLSNDYYLFSDERLSSKITAFFGSRSLRGRISPVDRANYPPLFANDRFRGTLYRLEDIVVDTGALLEKFSSDYGAYIFQGSPQAHFDVNGNVSSLTVDGLSLTANHYVFTAGSGNEALLRQQNVAMQRRPLKQVMLTHPALPETYAHAVSAGAGAKPRVTITTHRLRDGTPVWYLGGNLAETGVSRSDEEQINAAQREIASLFPWLNLDGARWATLDVDRAEPAQKDASRPDSPHLAPVGNNAFVCWPTKLTLTPLLADELLAMLPPQQHAAGKALPPLPSAPVGETPWEIAFR